MKDRESITQQLIAQGLLRLMRIYPFEEITITQICQEAQVARQTFYRNYPNKREVLRRRLWFLARDFQLAYPPSATNMEDNLRTFFQKLPFPREMLQLLQAHNLFFLVEEACIQGVPLAFSLGPTPPGYPYGKYQTAFIASTVTCVLRLWVEGGFQEPVQELADITIGLFRGTMNSLRDSSVK